MNLLPLVSLGDGRALLFVNITDGDEGTKGCHSQLSEFQEIYAIRKGPALKQFMTDPAFASASTYPFPMPLAPSRS